MFGTSGDYITGIEHLEDAYMICEDLYWQSADGYDLAIEIEKEDKTCFRK